MKKNKLAIILVSILSSILLLLVASILFIKNQAGAVDEGNSEQIRIEVPSGTSAHELASLLKSKGLIKNKDIFYFCARFPLFHRIATGSSNSLRLKSGVYHLSKNMSMDDMFDVLESGKQDYIVISIPEGLTISKIGKKLEERGVCSADDFRKACSDPEILEKYKIQNELSLCEGFLFPDTYYLNPTMQASAVVNLMIENFFNQAKQIPNIDLNDAEKINQTVRLASVIEREYRRPEEAPLISSVFHNRLKIGMGLYSCATVEYIITEIEGRSHPEVITYNDLKIDSPYNTYKWAGLPPGAISNPGKTALTAALNPAKTKYLYFRLIDAKSGKHVFTSDFSDHVNEGFSASTKK